MSNQSLRAKRACSPATVRATAYAAALVALSAMSPAQATLSYNASAQVYGNLYTQFSSPLLGGVGSFTLAGASDYKGADALRG